jgi:hypothetical protein
MSKQRGQIQAIILAAAAVCIIAVIVVNIIPATNISGYIAGGVR